ncbi:hypothetical protein HR12_26745 [Microbacterium sp. SUBG005]|nr:hypothetical protein HR12_26745 [Microbacterium sp. SUBG005]
MSMPPATTRARSPEIRSVPTVAAEASTVSAEPDTVSSVQVPVTRTVCSEPETLWLAPSPHESALGSAAGVEGFGSTVTTGAGVASVPGVGDSVTTDGDGTDAEGEASAAP